MHPSQALAAHRNIAIAVMIAVVLAVIAAVAVYLQSRTGAVVATHYFGSPVRTHYFG